MSEHIATIEWKMSGPDFRKGQFSREHTWTFDGGATIPASPSPYIVPAPWSNPAGIDPEEAFVASIASCHMLSWLWLAGKGGFDVLSYRDKAVGTLTKNEKGVLWVSGVTLRPEAKYGERLPSKEEESQLHHRAHRLCFIANSVKTEISIAAPLSPQSNLATA